jgi:hypothetical protein
MENKQRGRGMDKTYLPHQQRVLDEKAELDTKVAALDAFIASDRFVLVEREERLIMRGQLAAMQVYSGFLCDRIAVF